jgi:hypothetical protein
MSTMATGAALAAENRSLEIDGATLRYRRFGDSGSGATPLICLQCPRQFGQEVRAFLDGD